MTHSDNRDEPTGAEVLQAPFIKSTFSGGQGSCVGIKPLGDRTVVGKHELAEDSPLLVFPSSDWDAFCDRLARGIHASTGEVEAVFTHEGGFTLTQADSPDSPVIAYDAAEWEAFRLGIEAGELRSTAAA